MDIRHAVGVKVGIPSAKLAALSSWETSPAFSDRERAALEFATGIVRDDRDVTDECFERLRQHFSEPEVLELTFIANDRSEEHTSELQSHLNLVCLLLLEKKKQSE